MTSETLTVLGRLSARLNRSLAVYLSDAVPYFAGRNSEVAETLQFIVKNQREMVERINDLIMENGGAIEHGHFPIHFSGLHDLGIDYLIDCLVSHQKAAVSDIEKMRDQLSLAPHARALAEECLGEAKGHLDSLLEVQGNIEMNSTV
ncbi:MAG: hypothetical protein ACI9HK_004401 [Pirellulaceae bacterium]|jgi:hypothetical protein